jgi:hypothetical protein
MKLLKQYIDKLPKDLKFDTFEFIKKNNILYLNEDYKNVLIEDLIRIDFNNLYPNIILGLYNEGLIDTKWESDIKQLKSFLENVDELKRTTKELIGKPYDDLQDSILSSYKSGRIHANGLYGKIKSPLVVEYLHLIYTDIIEKYKDDIVYIDVDMIICKKDIDISNIPAKSEMSKLEYFYIENKNRYILFYNGQLETKGHSKFTNMDLLQLVKSEIRTRRLNKIGI